MFIYKTGSIHIQYVDIYFNYNFILSATKQLKRRNAAKIQLEKNELPQLFKFVEKN